MLLDTPLCDFGWQAPDFTLRDPNGNEHSLKANLGGKGLLVAFICNHCPYVIHVADELKTLADEAAEKGVQVIGINSNDVENYPDDAPEKMKTEKSDRGYNFPYLFDADQSVAKAYGAACTPDFFLFDKDQKLTYRGQFDSSRPKMDPPMPVTGEDLRAAIDATLKGSDVPQEQKPSIGCNIKWKPGNEPSYFAGGKA